MANNAANALAGMSLYPMVHDDGLLNPRVTERRERKAREAAEMKALLEGAAQRAKVRAEAARAAAAQAEADAARLKAMFTRLNIDHHLHALNVMEGQDGFRPLPQTKGYRNAMSVFSKPASRGGRKQGKTRRVTKKTRKAHTRKYRYRRVGTD